MRAASSASAATSEAAIDGLAGGATAFFLRLKVVVFFTGAIMPTPVDWLRGRTCAPRRAHWDGSFPPWFLSPPRWVCDDDVENRDGPVRSSPESFWRSKTLASAANSGQRWPTSLFQPSKLKCGESPLRPQRPPRMWRPTWKFGIGSKLVWAARLGPRRSTSRPCS